MKKLIHDSNLSYFLFGAWAFYLFSTIPALGEHLDPKTTLHMGNQYEKRYTKPQDIHIKGQDLLIAAHCNSDCDYRKLTRKAADETMAFAKDSGMETIYLQESLNRVKYFCMDKNPTHIAYSYDGSFKFNVPAPKVILIGGYFSLCLRISIRDLLKAWNGQKTDLNITLVAPAIYGLLNSRSRFLSSDLIQEVFGEQAIHKDKWKKFFRDKIRPLERRHGESVPLSWILDQFPSKADAFTYLAHWLRKENNFKNLFPNHRVIFKYDDKEKILQKTGKESSPTLTFQVVDHNDRTSLTKTLRGLK